ncbi:MAG: hypothetical protein WAS33_07690 [Candidatus Promineifilaceae bacterium]
MKGMPSELKKRLIQTLDDCAQLSTHQDLMTLFVDRRIATFGNSLPEASNRMGRINNLILHLHNKYDKYNQNSLVLFFYVLLDQTSEQTDCYQKISQTIQSLEHEIGKWHQPNPNEKQTQIFYQPPLNQTPDEHISNNPVRVFEKMNGRFSEEETRTLCFLLDIDFEALSGENLTGKIRELVRFWHRRKQLDVLVTKLREVRPDISI